MQTIYSILNHNKYHYTYGMLMENRGVNQGTGRNGFNGKENDREFNGNGNGYDFGARLLNTRLGRWMSLDPLAKKYTSLSPYHFGYNNPIITVDKNGEENVIVIGNASLTAKQDDKRDVYQNLMIAAGLNEALNAKNENGDNTTILIRKGSYTKSALEGLKKQATDNGITLIEVSNQEEIKNYINDKKLPGKPADVNGTEVELSRAEDQITGFAYVGHGSPWSMLTNYPIDQEGLKPEEFKAEAFSAVYSWARLISCNSNNGMLDNMTKYFAKNLVTEYATGSPGTCWFDGKEVKCMKPGTKASQGEFVDYRTEVGRRPIEMQKIKKKEITVVPSEKSE